MLTTPVDPPCDLCGHPKGAHLAGPIRLCPLALEGERYSATDVFRRRAADMPRLGVAPHPDVPLGSYVHAGSGGRYEVIGGVFDASGGAGDVHVLYQSPGRGYLAHRPPAEFAAKFRRVESPDA